MGAVTSLAATATTAASDAEEDSNGISASASAAPAAFACIWSGDKLGAEVKNLLPNTTYIFRVQVFFYRFYADFTPLIPASRR
jgi:hypothetical protein